MLNNSMSLLGCLTNYTNIVFNILIESVDDDIKETQTHVTIVNYGENPTHTQIAKDAHNYLLTALAADIAIISVQDVGKCIKNIWENPASDPNGDELAKYVLTKYSRHPEIKSPWHGMSENIAYPYFEIAAEIAVELPFVLDGWQHSVILADWDKEDLFTQVLDYYQLIRLVLKEHDATKFLEMSKEKTKLQEEAFYFDEEQKKDFLNGAAQLFVQNLDVEELNPSDLTLEIMGHGKLVRLMRKDGTQPLQFKSPDIEKQSNIELEVKLHLRSKEKGFSII